MQNKLTGALTSGKYDVVVANLGLWDMLHLDVAPQRTEDAMARLVDALDDVAAKGRWVRVGGEVR